MFKFEVVNTHNIHNKYTDFFLFRMDYLDSHIKKKKELKNKNI